MSCGARGQPLAASAGSHERERFARGHRPYLGMVRGFAVPRIDEDDVAHFDITGRAGACALFAIRSNSATGADLKPKSVSGGAGKLGQVVGTCCTRSQAIEEARRTLPLSPKHGGRRRDAGVRHGPACRTSSRKDFGLLHEPDVERGRASGLLCAVSFIAPVYDRFAARMARRFFESSCRWRPGRKLQNRLPRDTWRRGQADLVVTTS